MPVLLLLIAAPSIRGIVPRAAVTGMPAVATMATVSEHVHRDKYNADQHPKPIFYQPVHLDSFT